MGSADFSYRPVETIREFFDHLPDAQRDALILVCREGLSYQDAAQRLDVPVTDLVQDLVVARKTLINALHLTL